MTVYPANTLYIHASIFQNYIARWVNLLSILLIFPNQDFHSDEGVLVSIPGPYCPGLMLGPLFFIPWDQECHKYQHALHVENLIFFLFWVAHTFNKAKVVTKSGPGENWRWASIGIAENGKKFEWQEFCISLMIPCYFHLCYSYTKNQGKIFS